MVVGRTRPNYPFSKGNRLEILINYSKLTVCEPGLAMNILNEI